MRLIKQIRNLIRHFKVGGWTAVQTVMRESGKCHVHVLSRNPAVIYMWWGRDDSALYEQMKGLPLVVMYLFPWCFSESDVPEIKKKVAARSAYCPMHRIIFLCNEERAAEVLRGHGFEAHFIHQNAFVNEYIFHPMPEIERTYDAIYNASLAPYKRLELAEKVDSLIVLAYYYEGNRSKLYAKEIRKRLSHAWWPREPLEVAEKWPVNRVVETYARAHAGLCLSEVEGGMFVSMEYLLSGLGIVSTESAGGRSAFWDEEYVIVCEDTPEAVAEAVIEIKKRRIPPELIRTRTLDKIREHRKRFHALMKSLRATCECPWPPGSHGPTDFVDLTQLGRDLRKGLL